MQFGTITREHGHNYSCHECKRTDLFLVSEGVQCGNCLVLVTEHRPIIKDRQCYKDIMKNDV